MNIKTVGQDLFNAQTTNCYMYTVICNNCNYAMKCVSSSKLQTRKSLQRTRRWKALGTVVFYCGDGFINT